MNNSLKFYKTSALILASALILIATAFFFYNSTTLTFASSLNKATSNPTAAATAVTNSYEPRISCGSVLVTYSDIDTYSKTKINLLNGCGMKALNSVDPDQKMGVANNGTRMNGGLSIWGESHCVISDVSTSVSGTYPAQTKVVYTCYADAIN